jgi:hypothetical protein
MFEDTFQSNFCSAKYEAYDDNVDSYEIIKKNSKSFFNSSMSITYEISKEKKSLIISIKIVFLNALYDEKSDLNKRSH